MQTLIILLFVFISLAYLSKGLATLMHSTGYTHPPKHSVALRVGLSLGLCLLLVLGACCGWWRSQHL